jgi:glycerate kinase
MSIKILIAPDSFKQCIDSISLAALIEDEFKKFNNYELKSKPISDGGDGFLNVCNNYFHLEEIKYSVSTAYNEDMITCQIGYDRVRRNIFIESAEVLGLKKIPAVKRKPLKLNSKGLGELLLLIKSDVEKGKLNCNSIYIGIGGTGTVDFGLGMCSKLGLQTFDFYKKEMRVLPENYFRMGEIYPPDKTLPFNIICVVDVHNQLRGQDGAVIKFAPQKGASPSDIKLLELGFSKILNILQKKNLIDIKESLSGAGGGIAAALQIFYNSEIIQAKDFILNTLDMKNEIDHSEIIITGEGNLDSQSLLGKGAFSIAEYALQKNKKVFFVCGKSEMKTGNFNNDKFSIIELNSFMRSENESIQNVNQGISLACELIRSKL